MVGSTSCFLREGFDGVHKLASGTKRDAAAAKLLLGHLRELLAVNLLLGQLVRMLLLDANLIYSPLPDALYSPLVNTILTGFVST